MNIWDDAIQVLQETVDKHSFDTWFQPVIFISFIDGIVHLQVPNDKFKSWMNKKYLSSIEEAFEELGFPDVQINLFSKEESAPKKKTEEKPKERSQYNTKYIFDTFVVGPSNQFAHAACRAVAESPSKIYNPLFIYGGVGLGKTHLLNAIAAQIIQNTNHRVLYVSSETFVNDLISSIRHENTNPFRERYRNNDVLLVDDIQFLAGKERTQEEFFHTFNALYDAQKQIIISSDSPPREIPTLEERLTSRFEMGLLADIQPPELETKVAILHKKAEMEKIRIEDDIAYFMASRVKSNIRELEGCLIRIVAYSSLTGKKITLDFVKEVLKDIWRDDEKPVTAEEIMKTVSDYYSVKIKDLKAKDNRRGIALPRQVAMYLTKELTNLSLPEIGRKFGGKHHSTVIHSIKKVEAMRMEDTNFNNVINNLKQFF